MRELQPIEQKQIEFYDSEITAVLVQDSAGRENVYIPLRPLVEGLGLSWSSQYKRLKRNPVLDDVCYSVAVTTTEPNRSRRISMLCIPISHLNGFLFGIDANRVKDELRPLIIAYQRECYRVLFDAFNGVESMTRFYRAVGYDGGWIEKRIKKHETSTDLNDVWLLHGVPIEQHDQLRDVLNKGVFGLTTAEHKQFKQIPEDAPLHDNMTRLELLISAIADESAIVLSEETEPKTYDENEQIARASAQFGKRTLEDFESTTGTKVLSSKNHLDKQKPPLLQTPSEPAPGDSEEDE